MTAHEGQTFRPYPLLFQPVLLEKVWGGRQLARLNKPLPAAPIKVGESWELADLGGTSASGAGGGAVRSVIANGPLAGKTLTQALEVLGSALIADPAALDRAKREGFPLLIKFLDAGENLSVQVHPSPTFLRAHPNAGYHLKTESWFIIDAKPGAKLYIGVKPGVSRSQFAQHIQDNTVVDDLIAVPAIPGECHTLPSGTIHALGGGIVVAEIQTPSDTTFRVYDWGRMGRELHIEESLACGTFADTREEERVPMPEKPSRLRQNALCARVATTEYYTIEQFRLSDGDEVTIGYRCGGCGHGKTSRGSDEELREKRRAQAECFVLMVLGGTGELRASDGSFETIALSTGQTVLIPAEVSLSAVLRAGNELNVLRVGMEKERRLV